MGTDMSELYVSSDEVETLRLQTAIENRGICAHFERGRRSCYILYVDASKLIDARKIRDEFFSET